MSAPAQQESPSRPEGTGSQVVGEPIGARLRRWRPLLIATAALAVLGVYGIVTGEQIAAWSLLASAITGLATANTSAGEKQVG